MTIQEINLAKIPIFDQSLLDIAELELLSKTKQILKFRLAFASVCFIILLAVKLFSKSEFNFPYVAAIILAVILYSSIAISLVRKSVLRDIQMAINKSQSLPRHYTEKNIVVLNAVLLGLDIIALTTLVHATKGIESDLYILYLLPILLSSYIFTRLGIYATSLFVSLSYIGLLLIENYQALLLFKESLQPHNITNSVASAYLGILWQRILWRSLIFTSVAFIWAGFCSYMARFAQSMTNRLRSQLRNNQKLMNEMKQVETQLIHHEKMASLGRLVAGIAHELNNPINFVHGNLPYLKNYCADMKEIIAACDQIPQEQKAAVEEQKAKLKYDFLVTDLDNILADMEEGVGRIRQIIKNLRSFGRLDEAELKEASISEGIESTLKILGQYYGKDKIPVKLNLQEMPPILCYPGQLNQLWMNLLSNAAQALEQVNEPLVQVHSELTDEHVLVSIIDNGLGIKDENQTKIFEPFFTTKPVGMGTGLGLSICHSIVERHQGKIWFEPYENGGTVFKVLIPCHIQVNQPAH
jgi:signal transduction histidine kinase